MFKRKKDGQKKEPKELKQDAAIQPLGATLQRSWHIERPEATQLVVIMKGLGSSKYIEDVVGIVAEKLSSASILVPKFDSRLYSNVNIRTLVDHLTFMINAVLREKTSEKAENAYEEVILIGHSIGALIMRGAYIKSRGEALFDGDQSEEDQRWPVTRIIMLAGINSGWHAPSRRAVGLGRSLVFRWMIRKARWGKTAGFLLSTHSDGTFVINLRCRWLDLVGEEIKAGKHLPKIYQIQGDSDGLITNSDTDDFWGSKGFSKIRVPDTEHFNVGVFKVDTGTRIAESEKTKPRNILFRWLTKERVRTQEVHDRRRNIFIEALTSNDDGGDPRPDGINVSCRDVVWILHGIRDPGHWADALVRKIRADYSGSEATSTGYGIVSFLGFAVPLLRRRRVPKFIEAYTKIRAQYPGATIHFCGHSFGTYLFCRCLLRQVALSFGNVAFAGSVVYRDFDWDPYFASGRLKALTNYLGASDWVVALLPGYFEKLPIRPDSRFRDLLGSGGFEGFTKGVSKNQYIVKGGHSGAIGRQDFDSLAGFLAKRIFREPSQGVESVSGWLRFISTFNIVLLPIILVGLVALGMILWTLNMWVGASYLVVMLIVLVWL